MTEKQPIRRYATRSGLEDAQLIAELETAVERLQGRNQELEAQIRELQEEGVAVSYQLWEIEQQASRKDRANSEYEFLWRDLEFIAQRANRTRTGILPTAYLERLVAALEFYADERNWKCGAVTSEKGKRARAVLSVEEEK